MNFVSSPFQFAFTPPSSPTPTLPGDVINYVVQVNSEIGSLSSDMLSANTSGKIPLSADFVSQRDAFIAEWSAFRDNYLSVGWSVTIPSSAWDQVAQYESKNEAWRDQWKALGGIPSAPGPQDRPAAPDVTGAVKWGAAAVIAAAVGYGVWRFAGPRRSN